MAEHVWSVLCHRATQDKEDNVISLLEVVEKITAQVPTPTSLTEDLAEGRTIMATRLDFANWWVRSEYDKPESAAGRAAVIAPDGEEVAGIEYPIRLEESKSYRSIIRLPGIPADKGSGLFWFLAQIQDGDEWRTVARVPLEVEIKPEAAPAET